MKIEMWNIDRIKEYDGNPRDNSAAIDPVAASIKEFGFKVPVLVDRDDMLIAGHTRVRAARKLGLTKVPVIRATDLTPEQVRAFRLADNKLHELSSWNLDLLPLELAALKELEFDLNLLGFGQEELAELMGTGVAPGLTDPDEVPEAPEEAVTQPGDLWLLGEHRLLCGDATNADDVARLMDGKTAAMAFTDPPWNVSIGQD